MSLDEELILQRTTRLTVEFRDHAGIFVHVPDGSFMCGPHGLAVMDAFTRPISVKDAMARLKGRATGVQDWLDLIGTIESLRELGVLVPPREVQDGAPRSLGPEAVALHRDMLDDRERTSRFIEAIEATVRPGDVVVDLGTGTGILAMAAARAGAKRVFAIEAGRITGTARRLFEDNGLSETITLVEGWSTRVALPERADVLVSETIGNHPLSERVLEMTWDARQRFLHPGARTVPRRIRVLAQPVPRPVVAGSGGGFPPDAIGRWSQWYGFDFTALRGPVEEASGFLELSGGDVRALGALAPPAALGEVDLGAEPELVFEAVGSTTVDRGGSAGGVAIYFELDLADGIRLTNDPWKAADTSHWLIPVAILEEPLDVSPGDEVEIGYRYAGLRVGVECRVR